jgi:hypothetical protein
MENILSKRLEGRPCDKVTQRAVQQEIGEALTPKVTSPNDDVMQRHRSDVTEVTSPNDDVMQRRSFSSVDNADLKKEIQVV